MCNITNGDFPNVQYPKRQLSKCAISLTATSQVCPLPHPSCPHPVLTVALGFLAHPSPALGLHFSLRRLIGPYLTIGKLPLKKFHLGSRPWENAFEKVLNAEIHTVLHDLNIVVHEIHTVLHDIHTVLHDINTVLHDTNTVLHEINTVLHDINTVLHDICIT